MAEDARWYVIHTFSGYEKKVQANIEKSVDNRNLHDLILDIKVPMEEVVETKGNEQKVVQRKVFPGYVMVKMIMT
ncbi:MAG: transcription termination/antitermination NusG family protein, partial [Clostridia bacterium]